MIPRRTLRRTLTLTPTLTSHLSLLAAQAPAHHRLSPALPHAAHASATVSLVPALASSSTAVALAAATLTLPSARPSPRMNSTLNAPPAARVSSSASRRLVLPSCSRFPAGHPANEMHARGENTSENRTYPTLVARSFLFPPIVWLIFCQWSCSCLISQGLQLVCSLSCRRTSDPGCANRTSVNPAMTAALRSFARRPAARERTSKRTWRVYRLYEDECRPGDRAWMEPCINDKEGYDACCDQSSSSPVVTALSHGGDQADYSVATRPKYSSVKINPIKYIVAKDHSFPRRLQRLPVAIKS
jgi:hypothetical protein